MRGMSIVTAGLFGLTFVATASAQTAKPTEITKIQRDPLPIFETADTGTLIRQIKLSELPGPPPPWPILDQSDNGMYLIELDGQRVWVVDSTVKVDAMVSGSALTPSGMNFADPDLAGSRGYGD